MTLKTTACPYTTLFRSLEVVVGNLLEAAAQPMTLPFLLQLAAVVVAPTAPAHQVRQVRLQPALELRPDLGQRLGGIDLGLADVSQFAAEAVRQGRRSGRTKRWKCSSSWPSAATRLAPISMISMSSSGQPPSSVVASRSMISH